MLFLVGAGMFFDGFDIYLAAGVLGALVREGVSNVDSNAWFLSATFAGMTIGAWLAGILGDRFGRRFSYQFNLAIFGLASFGAAFCAVDRLVGGGAVLHGVGAGAEIVVGYGTLSEFMPPSIRGRYAALLNLFTNSALFVATFGGFLIIPYLGWRWMFTIAGVGAGAVWLARKNMPESPRWLESKGRLGRGRTRHPAYRAGRAGYAQQKRPGGGHAQRRGAAGGAVSRGCSRASCGGAPSPGSSSTW